MITMPPTRTRCEEYGMERGCDDNCPVLREGQCEVADELHDNINHPPHYTFGRFEVIDVIEDWGLGYHLGNAVKYIARAGRKDASKTTEDLKKAAWYLERYIKQANEDAA